MKLLYVRGVGENNKNTASKKDWALFLSTDVSISATEMLEVYAMRWSIEVYFKESKQHLKWLGEQTRTYASHVASLHLSAVCYLLLVHVKLTREFETLGAARRHLNEVLETLNYAHRLWQMFRVIIHQAIDSVQSVLDGQSATAEKEAIEHGIEEFLIQVLQLNPSAIRQDHELIAQPA